MRRDVTDKGRGDNPVILNLHFEKASNISQYVLGAWVTLVVLSAFLPCAVSVTAEVGTGVMGRSCSCLEELSDTLFYVL